MAIYGFVRCFPLKKEKPLAVQVEQLARRAEELGGKLAHTFVDHGDSDTKTAILDRPAGKEMLATLKAGDTLVVHSLDRLGCSMPDVEKTLSTLWEREVRICVLPTSDVELDLTPDTAKPVLALSASWARTEKVLRSERSIELARRRKEQGLAYGGAPFGQKIVQRDGDTYLEWDWEQLAIVTEVAERHGKGEPWESIARDLWNRGVEDHRGLPWGCRFRSPSVRHFDPWDYFRKWTLRFHRMKRKGLLPPAYGKLALTIQEPKGFREKPKPKTWTRGGTERRAKERADAKAQHHAEKLARWQAERAARVQARVHKPAVAKLGITPWPSQ